MTVESVSDRPPLESCNHPAERTYWASQSPPGPLEHGVLLVTVSFGPFPFCCYNLYRNFHTEDERTVIS